VGSIRESIPTPETDYTSCIVTTIRQGVYPSDKEVGYVGKKKKKKVKKGVESVPCGKKKKPKGK
jgi:hypothetical protein